MQTRQPFLLVAWALLACPGACFVIPRALASPSWDLRQQAPEAATAVFPRPTLATVPRGVLFAHPNRFPTTGRTPLPPHKVKPHHNRRLRANRMKPLPWSTWAYEDLQLAHWGESKRQKARHRGLVRELTRDGPLGRRMALRAAAGVANFAPEGVDPENLEEATAIAAAAIAAAEAAKETKAKDKAAKKSEAAKAAAAAGKAPGEDEAKPKAKKKCHRFKGGSGRDTTRAKRPTKTSKTR